jgi:hypothetical protein
LQKTAAARWTEITEYLNKNFDHDNPKIGDHINKIVTDKKVRDKLSDEVALGSTKGVHDNTKENKPARNALRALLLCQRVYFSELWAKRTFVGGETKLSTFLPNDWKAKSLAHWGKKTEAEILSAIAMFATVKGVNAAKVSDVAKTDGAPSGKDPQIAGNLTVSRANFPLTGAKETCYRGVLAWLLKAGVVSFRWFMQNSGPSGSKALGELFGDGEEVWDSNKAFTDQSTLPTIPKGFILHMYMEETKEAGWNGHWVISNGDGTICGVNNGEVKKDDETVIKAYTKDGKLRSQFEGYTELVKEEDDGKGKGNLKIVRTGKAAKAHLVKFDPMKLKNRM